LTYELVLTCVNLHLIKLTSMADV